MIYSGWGRLVIPIWITMMFLQMELIDNLSGDSRYFEKHIEARLLAYFTSGLTVWIVGRVFNRKKAALRYFEYGTAKTELKTKHTLGFIPVEYWGGVTLLLGLAIEIYNWSKNH